MSHKKKIFRRKSGFTVIEAVVAMALVVLITGAFLTTCAVAANFQKRSTAATRAYTVAAEFISAFSAALEENSETEEGQFIAAFHEKLSFAFGISINFTGESGEFKNGMRSLRIETKAGIYRYYYEEGAAGVEAQLNGRNLEASGYVEGYSAAVCSYVCGEEGQ